jgi:AraC-like DNA-binding protein
VSDILSIVILLGIVQGFYLGLILLVMKSPNRRANRFLGLLLFSFSISISHFLFLRIGAYQVFPDLLQVSFPVLFLFGPLYYFYVQLLTDRTHVLRWKDLLHGLPFLIVVAVSIPFHFLRYEEKLAYYVRLTGDDYVHHGILLGFIQIVHLSCYLIAAHRILRAYEMQIRSVRSSVERITLRWLQQAMNRFVVVFGMIFVLGALQIFGIPTMKLYGILVPVFVTIINFLMGALGFRQPEIFAPTEVEEKSGKYQRSALTPEKRDEYLVRLDNYMKSQKPHRDPELTLPGLAGGLSIPAHQLSQLLNETVGQTFFDFVNRARVEEAKRLLTDPGFASFTILAVATEAGFNSKTAFNAAFKKYAGVTPSAFRSTPPTTS